MEIPPLCVATPVNTYVVHDEILLCTYILRRLSTHTSDAAILSKYFPPCCKRVLMSFNFAKAFASSFVWYAFTSFAREAAVRQFYQGHHTHSRSFKKKKHVQQYNQSTTLLAAAKAFRFGELQHLHLSQESPRIKACTIYCTRKRARALCRKGTTCTKSLAPTATNSSISHIVERLTMALEQAHRQPNRKQNPSPTVGITPALLASPFFPAGLHRGGCQAGERAPNDPDRRSVERTGTHPINRQDSTASRGQRDRDQTFLLVFILLLFSRDGSHALFAGRCCHGAAEC